MAILARRGGGSRRRMLADINVVPYIDVMLVLVVILMVAAPFVNPNLVELPSVGRASRAPSKPIEIVVYKEGGLAWRDLGAGGKAVKTELPKIVAVVKARQAKEPDTPIVIAADKGVLYERVTEVMNALYREDVKRVGLAVQPAN